MENEVVKKFTFETALFRYVSIHKMQGTKTEVEQIQSSV